MTRRPDFLSFDVQGGVLGALRWVGIDGAPTVLAIHGITANGWYFDPLAHQLSGGAHLFAVDLRGRGRSLSHAGPFGLRTHAADVVAVARQLDEQVLLVAHAMGVNVALLAMEMQPDLFSGIVAVDGGCPLPLPEGSVEDALVASLGPAVARLRVVWPDRVSYQTMWSQHPAFQDGIGLDLQRTLLADLVEGPEGFRTAVSEASVLIDGRDLLVDEHVRSVLERSPSPISIIRAENGPHGTPPPLITDEAVERFPEHRWTTVPGTNHYTVLLGVAGASTVADAIRGALAT